MHTNLALSLDYSKSELPIEESYPLAECLGNVPSVGIRQPINLND